MGHTGDSPWNLLNSSRNDTKNAQIGKNVLPGSHGSSSRYNYVICLYACSRANTLICFTENRELILNYLCNSLSDNDNKCERL